MKDLCALLRFSVSSFFVGFFSTWTRKQDEIFTPISIELYGTRRDRGEMYSPHLSFVSISVSILVFTISILSSRAVPTVAVVRCECYAALLLQHTIERPLEAL